MDEAAKIAGFERHVRMCNNAVLPGGRLAFRIGDRPVGWVTPGIAEASGLAVSDGGAILRNGDKLPGIARDLADRGLCAWRNEAFDVRSVLGGPVLARIDRGAIPAFGLMAVGVHVNGLVRTPDGLWLWVARRAADKRLDPGKLDHVVAGGVPSGLGPLETLVKEAGEEAAIPPDLAARAVLAGQINYAMDRPEGLRRDFLYCYDLDLPEDFTPVPADGEVEAFELWPLRSVFETVRDTDDFKFNVNLVLIDLFIRLGLIKGAEAAGLRCGLTAAP